MRSRPFTLVVVLSTVALLAVAAPAAAAQTTDGNDVPGKLDLKTLTGTKSGASAPLQIKLTTYGSWPKSMLKDGGGNRIFILFNVDSDPKIEYVGEILKSGGKLHMDVSGSGSSFEPLPVRHPNGRTIVTVVPGSSPPNPDGTVQIAARSVFRDAGACATACRDRVPNVGWLSVP